MPAIVEIRTRDRAKLLETTGDCSLAVEIEVVTVKGDPSATPKRAVQLVGDGPVFVKPTKQERQIYHIPIDATVLAAFRESVAALVEAAKGMASRGGDIRLCSAVGSSSLKVGMRSKTGKGLLPFLDITMGRETMHIAFEKASGLEDAYQALVTAQQA